MSRPPYERDGDHTSVPGGGLRACSGAPSASAETSHAPDGAAQGLAHDGAADGAVLRFELDRTLRCEDVRPQLSALADGEVATFEAIAIRRHLGHCELCRHDAERLEQIKLACHRAGRGAMPPSGYKVRLKATVQAVAAAERAERLGRWWTGALVGATALAACALTIAWPFGEADPAHVAVEVAPAAPMAMDRASMARFVDVHYGRSDKESLRDLQESGAMVAFEPLPGTFITEEGEKPQVVHATVLGCDGAAPGASIVVLRADRVELPVEMDADVSARGVYQDVIDGMEVRVSRSHEKVFVLLSEVSHVTPVADEELNDASVLDRSDARRAPDATPAPRTESLVF